MTLNRTILLASTSLFSAFLASPALADCISTGGSSFQCSGDFSGQQITLPGDIPDSTTSVTITNLTSDLGPLDSFPAPYAGIVSLNYDAAATADTISLTIDSTNQAIATNGFSSALLVSSIAANGSGTGAGADGRDITLTSNIDTNVAFVSGDGGFTPGTQLLTDGGLGGTPDSTSGAGLDGGKGGKGGDITTALSGTYSVISGTGDFPIGLLAWSQGGDGGTGGKSTGGNGGDGGTGGDGGKLEIAASGALEINVRGTPISTDRYAGIVALSVGGDGGVGGSGSDKQGSAGAGGAGGAITFQDSAGASRTIVTDGLPGIYLLSQGGKAGDTGHDIAGPSGNGGAITKNAGTTTTITTTGDNAVAFLAISRGGDGVETNSTYNVPGAGGDITIKDTWYITTDGTYGHGIAAYSIAGQVAKDASKAIAGSGGTVTIDTAAGTITTNGDQSFGIVAQSIGGHNGSGGTASDPTIKFGVSQEAPQGVSEAVQIGNRAKITTNGQESAGIGAQSSGGGGGSYGSDFDEFFSGEAEAGGAGGQVGVVNHAEITTTNSGSDAILAQSIGGAGGIGTASTSGSSLGSNTTLDGSDGGMVTVANYATLNAGGTGTVSVTDSSSACSGGCSVGIMAQSVGGGGGKGHTATGAFSAVGGTGGSGGDGGQVTVLNLGDINTYRDHSAGIEAQSIGGGGGMGGGAISGGVGVSHSVGGQGGNGGKGGDVSVQHVYAAIATEQDNSDGIHVQSVGGGGGRGGYAISGTVQGASLSVGGAGGDGGDGQSAGICIDETDGTNSANCQAISPTTTTPTTIVTQGNNSKGVFAHSVGGGGGNGGFAVAASAGFETSAAFAIGGSGGKGGDGGYAEIVGRFASIQTSGDDSAAVAVISAGGGGGNGGLAVEGTVTITEDGGASFGLALGGNGSAGGSGDEVSVNVSGNLWTTGDRSTGILAQSVGGSGGNGGISASGTVTSDAGSVGVGVAVGGNGGKGNDADKVIVQYGVIGGEPGAGQIGISTAGHASHGIAAQSIGGGGGHGGMALSGAVSINGATDVSLAVGGSGGSGGSGGIVEVYNQGDTIQTTGSDSHGILAQSNGGGGGYGGFSLSGNITQGNSQSFGVSVGGDGSDGGAASTVTVQNHSTITVQGDKSKGVVAQSIGGAGGYGGMAFTGSITFKEDSKTAGVSIGGKGGKGGSSDQVEVDNYADITTGNKDNAAGSSSNHHEYGILAQSISGDGGYGGMAITGETNQGQKSVQVTIGGSGGGTNAAGAVQVTNTATVTTYSYNSDAVVAQSIGGNGGAGGATLNSTFTSNSDASSKTYSVSIGGDGGSGAEGKDVTVTHSNGTIQTAGENSSGIVAQSIGGGGGHGGSNIAYSATTTSVDKASASKVSVNLGGAGGDGSASGEVTVNFDSGSIFTGFDVTKAQDESARNNRGHGIFALSQAGGGGSGGIGMVGSVETDKDDDGGSLTVGGNGGSAAAADLVKVTAKGDGSITTYLMNSDGILAQSIGGGGGNGAIGIDGDVSNSGSKGVFGLIGGSGAGGSDGGAVQVTVSNIIVTQGANSRGIAAQSIGGGGGDGGVGVSGSVSSEDKEGSEGKAFGLAVGGSGGHASDGGAVTVKLESAGQIFTLAEDTGPNSASHGIFAQSVGGGGGNGGYGVGTDLSTSVDGGKAALLSFGGAGGTSGSGGTVTVDHYGSISVAGNFSYGILAHSIGGGGGAGGLAIGGSVNSSEGYALLLGAQGSSSHVGNGGTINTTVTGAVTTAGDIGHGIVLQSIGAGGGAVGAAMLGGVVQDEAGSDPSGSMTMVLGASGTSGGNSGGTGGTINFNTTQPTSAVGDITTAGSASIGILAQSIGGGGGAAVTMFGGESDNLNATIGNALGVQSDNVAESNGGAINATNYANIQTGTKASSDPTEAIQSHGLVAQSIGAGGGLVYTFGELTYHGSKTVSNYAGAAETEGNGGAIELVNSGQITTYGTDSHGLLAQTIGGGGGILGNLTELSFTSGHTYLSETVLGGGGGSNTSAVINNTQVWNNDQITTHGDGSYGILIQNITGGGGYSSSMFGIAAALNDATGTTVNLAPSRVGGVDVKTEGEQNGNPVSSELILNNSAPVTTHGDGATAILAQAIGGGGGVAFDGGWNAKNTTPFANIYAHEGTSTLFILGGSGVGGEDNNSQGASGNAVIVNHNNGAIKTSGWGSSGIVAQSVGGGGGRAMTGVVTSDDYTVYVGGLGGTEGDGGDVTVKVASAASVTTGVNDNTYAVSAIGVFAQSVGGGGGHGGVADFQGANAGTGLASESFLKQTDGAGGTVSVEIDGSIQTYGNSSVGVFAQSVGGGGGVIGTPTASTAVSIGSNGGNGKAGEVDVTVKGSVKTVGQAAHALLAQSASGDNHDGNDVTVTVASGATVSATGNYAYGVWVDSAGGDGHGNMTVSNSGTISGGCIKEKSGGSTNSCGDSATEPGSEATAGQVTVAAAEESAGIVVTNALTATIANSGTITTVDGVEGHFLRSEADTLSVDNTGMMVGELHHFGAGATVHNQGDGTIQTGAVFDLGGDGGGRLINEGRVEVFGDSNRGTTDLEGEFIQFGPGTLSLDLDPVAASGDLLNIAGTAALEGTLDFNLLSLKPSTAGPSTITVFTSDGGLTLPSGELGIVPSAVVGYETAYSASDIAVTYDVDFTLGSDNDQLSTDERALADYLVALQDSGEMTNVLLELTEIETIEDYGVELTGLGGGVYADTQASMLFSTLAFEQAATQCRQAGLTSVDQNGRTRCAWVQLGAEHIDVDDTGHSKGFDTDYASIAGGIETGLYDGQTRVGAAFQYTDYSLDSIRASSDGQSLQGLIRGERTTGRTTYGAFFGGGNGWFDTTRTALGDSSFADYEVPFLNGGGYIRHRIDRGAFYVEPKASVGFTNFFSTSATERTDGGVALDVHTGSQTIVYARPALRVGTDRTLSQDLTLSVFGEIGLTGLSENDLLVNATFQGASSGLGSFRTTSPIGNFIADVDAGVTITSQNGWEFRAGAFSRFSDSLTSAGGRVQAGFSF